MSDLFGSDPTALGATVLAAVATGLTFLIVLLISFGERRYLISGAKGATILPTRCHNGPCSERLIDAAVPRIKISARVGALRCAIKTSRDVLQRM